MSNLALSAVETHPEIETREGNYKVASTTACVDGKAGGYSCNNVDLKGFLRHQDLGSRTRVGNDVWGTYSSCDTK